MLENKTISLHILFSDGQKIVKNDLFFVSLATFDGEISILKDHSDLVTELEVGKVIATHHNNTKEIFLIYKAIAIVRDSKIVVTTELCEEIQLQNKNQMLHNIEKYQEALKLLKDKSDINVIKNEIKKYTSMMKFF
ncbi:MAG: hypothetical protein ISN64_03795 [Rickettsia sp.]|nr:hypothetical protein [Rickettsia sp.]